MKPSTSKVDGKKRKRDAPPVVPETVKKSKVHAQRKFAQGSGLASPAIGPIKDREKTKLQSRNVVPAPEPLLINKVPTTEQFLDFLCFGRTALLPQELHYLRDASLPNTSTNNKLSPQQIMAPVGRKADKSDGEKAKPPAAVQALRKKYQEQRLAKQKSTSVAKLAKKVKGKNMVRTRSTVVKEEFPKAVETVVAVKGNKKVVIGLRSGLNRVQNAVAIVKAQKRRAKKVKLQRVGLRSGGKVHLPKTVAKESPKLTKTEQDGPGKDLNLVVRKKPRRSHLGELGSDFSSDDNEPLLTPKKQRQRGAVKPQVRTRSRVEERGKVGNELRPSRRTKASPAVSVEPSSRKLALANPHSNEDDAITETFPTRREKRENEPKSSTIPKKGVNDKYAAAKGVITKKKGVIRKTTNKSKGDASPNRPSTRSTPSDKPQVKLAIKSTKKAVIRDLIQKKKQMSLRTLSRLKQNKRKPSMNHMSSNEMKKSEKKGKISISDKNDDLESPARRLRGKTTDINLPEKGYAKKPDLAKKATTKKAVEPKDKESLLSTKGKTKLKAEVSDSLLSKRPVRKCSTVDKMWIDVDGFTSDEDDFIDIGSIAADKKNEPENVNTTKTKVTRKLSSTESSSSSKQVASLATNSGKEMKGKKSNLKVETSVIPLAKKTSFPNDTSTKTSDKVTCSNGSFKNEQSSLKCEPSTTKFPVKTDSTPSVLKPQTGKKPEGSAKKVEKVPSSSSGTAVKPAVVCKTINSPLCNVPTKNSHQPMSETIPTSPNIPLNTSSSIGAVLNMSTNTPSCSYLPSCDGSSELRKGKLSGGTNKLIHSMETPPVENIVGGLAKAAEGENSHSLITKLATNASLTSKPSTFKLDIKSVSKDIKPSSSTYLGMIKEEKFIDAEIKFKVDVAEQSAKTYEVEDKKNIVSVVSPSVAVTHLGVPKDKRSDSKTSGNGPGTSILKNAPEMAYVESKPEEFSLTKRPGTLSRGPAPKLAKIATSIGGAHVSPAAMKNMAGKNMLSSPSTLNKITPSANVARDSMHSLSVQKMTSGCSKKEGLFKRQEKSIGLENNALATDVKEKISCKDKIDGSTRIRAVKPDVASITSTHKDEVESSENSSEISEKIVRKRGKRGRRPSPRAEVVTRRERPKRQCSATGKSWIERDSDDSSYYDDGEDVLELIRRSELEFKECEDRKRRNDKAEGDKDHGSETFSDSDDEPLMKKPLSAPSTGSPAATDVNNGNFQKKNCEGKSEVSQDCDNRAGASGLNADGTLSQDVVPAPAVTFHKVPREPINTHGLDLLSEVVAVQDKSNARIEQWLKENLRADGGKGFLGFDESEIRRPALPVSNSSIPDPVLQFVRSSPEKPKPTPPEIKKAIPKPEAILKRPPVSSVHDLLKLQKERKESAKPITEQHSKNCKCNSCVVKKAWFKNKPIPDRPKSVVKDVSPSKPFQALTQAFGEVTTAKASVSVAPFVQSKDKALSAPTRKLSFLERMRERERKEALVKPSSQPFSPSNESSVYAFEPETEKQSVATGTSLLPSSRTPSTSTSHEEDPEDDRARNQSTSIAVQVNLDTSTSTNELPPVDDGKSIEISTQTEGADEEPDSQMFYIPLQQSGAATSSQPLIQGVTVKLGTEGPVGPNQKVVMQAKLVTKPPNMPSMKAVVMPQQKLTESTKNTPPVGTVQPTTRRPPGLAPTPRLRDNISPCARVKDAQSSAKMDTRSQAAPVTPLRTEVPLATSTPRTPKEASKPSASSAPEASTSDAGKKQSSMLMEAPTFHLTEKEFQDPLEFFERIRPAAERFGLCRIVPPSSFKPDCKVADDMRFTAYNQYVHRMLHRWGPSVKETMAMKKYLKTQRISLKPPPCVGGMEVDLPRLYQAVQTSGGLMKVMEKQKWQQVADLMRIPKAAHDRATKLDAIYCQYLLPYDTLKPEERDKLLEEVDADWAAHEEKMGLGSEAEGEEEEEDYIEECEECIVKGRSVALSQFYRIARNTMSMWFKSSEPGPEEVEAEFWRHVTERKHHVCVHSGSIDSSGWGYGFPVGKNNFAKHPWNLKVLTNSSGSVLRSLGPVMGVTVPTLHVGMVFTAFCWYRDPHGLPWVEYLHTGAPKIWYGISDDNSTLFREALTKLLPKHIKEQRIWLPCDTAMAPPARLAELGVPLSRTTQHPGQFVLVFPRAFTSSLCTGYIVAESVYFARPSWLQTAEQAFRDIHDSAEPSVFSLDNLLLSIAADTRASLDVLNQVLPMVRRLREREREGRRALRELGLVEESLPRGTVRRRGRSADPEPEHECEVCRASLFLSMVSNSAEETVFCLKHGLQQLTAHKEQLAGSKLLCTHDQDEINQIVEKLEERIDAKVLKSNKK